VAVPKWKKESGPRRSIWASWKCIWSLAIIV
jgi:hypothetical protein